MVNNAGNIPLGNCRRESKILDQGLSNFVDAATGGPGKPNRRRARAVYKKSLPKVVEEEQSSLEYDCFDDGGRQVNVRS